jgi:hypothetical protein
MEILSHLLSALGHLLLWVSSLLVVEELMFGGLARLLLTRRSDSRERRDRIRRRIRRRVSAQQVSAARSKEAHGGASC